MRILIVEDHAVVREGLRRLLSPTGEHTFAEAVEGNLAKRLAQELRPHLIILDLNLPGLGGLELLKRLLDAGHGRVLVLTMHAEPYLARRALEAGAHGFVTKSAPPAELLRAVERISRGGRYVDTEVAQALALNEAAEGELPDLLSLREMEILRLLGKGSSLAEIGTVLGLSYKTVANNCAVMKSKLGITRTADLVRAAADSRVGLALSDQTRGLRSQA